MRSRIFTRGSCRSPHASWPYPTSTATTSFAPRRNKTSVNPPVEAPASRHVRPSISTPVKTSKAPANLWPPRETKSSRSPCRTMEVSASTCEAGFVAGIPPTRTERDSIRSAACSRERASSRRTSSASKRVFMAVC